MDKMNLRSFALGMLLSTCIIGSIYYYSTPYEQTEQQLKSALKAKGLVAVNEKEYEQLKQLGEQKRNSEDEQHSPQQSSPKEPEAIHVYRLTVSEGKYPRDIAKELEEAKIIPDDTDFTNYLEKRNLTRKIRVGTYTVTSQMTLEQISNMITGQK